MSERKAKEARRHLRLVDGRGREIGEEPAEATEPAGMTQNTMDTIKAMAMAKVREELKATMEGMGLEGERLERVLAYAEIGRAHV